MTTHDEPAPRAPLAPAERAYRRGCHQTAARLHDLAARCRSLPEVRDLLGRAEDVLADLRRSHEPAPCLLDVMAAQIEEVYSVGDAPTNGSAGRARRAP